MPNEYRNFKKALAGIKDQDERDRMSRLPMEERTLKKKLLLFQFIMVAISATLTIVSLEVITRVFAPTWLTQRMLDLNRPPGAQTFGSDQGWKVEIKNGHFWRFTPHSVFEVLDEYNNKAHIDEYGGRVTASADGAENKDLVPFLGDSFTFGLGVADTETFASLLSSVASPRRVLNLGVPATALYDQLSIVEIRHDELGRPKKYVFFFFIGNDFTDLMKLKPVTPWKLDAFVSASPLGHSYLVQFVRRQALDAINLVTYGPHLDSTFSIMNSENNSYRDAAEAALQEQINRLTQMRRKLGFSALLVVIPSREQTNSRLRNAKLSENDIPESFIDVLLPNRILREQTNGHELALVDPTVCITEHNADGSLYYTQDNHFTAKGHKVFADCIREDIAKFLGNRKSNP